MKTRKLRDIEVSEIGMGCMGFSTAYGKIPEESESIRLMREAHDKIQIHGNRTDEQIARLGELRTKMYGSSGVHDGK